MAELVVDPALLRALALTIVYKMAVTDGERAEIVAQIRAALEQAIGSEVTRRG